MNTGRLIGWLLLPLLALVIVGALAISLIKALFSLAFSLIVGGVVVGGGLYLYRRARGAISPGTRNGRRIQAATRTYKQRNR